MPQSRHPDDGSQGAVIGIVGDYTSSYAHHVATNDALGHVVSPIRAEWVPTLDLAGDVYERLARYSGLLIAPGSPYVSMDGALRAIRFARERAVPLIGMCGGFQHVVVEYSRNVLGIEDAEHAETSPAAARLAVTALTCSLAGQEHLVHLVPGSRVQAIYSKDAVSEPFFCNYGLNPDYRSALEEHGLAVAGAGEDGEVRVLELTGHSFFLATLYVPQVRSRRGAPHPLVSGFVEAARQHAMRSTNLVG